MPLRWFCTLAAAGVALAVAVPAGAQEAGPGPERTQKLIEELRSLLDRAEEKREADPWLIRDMREVIDKYAFPWTSTVYARTLTGNGGLPEGWRVLRGRFERTPDGLRSVTRAAARSSRGAEEQSSGDVDTRDLIGSMLDQALGQSSTEPREESADREAPSVEPARALLSARTGNAFAMRVRFTLRPADGLSAFAFGPYQGRDGKMGYRVVYAEAEGGPRLELSKLGSGGTESTVARTGEIDSLADGQRHTLMWTRDARGRMEIELNETRVIAARDRGFQDAFDGFALTNAGGKLAVESLVINDSSGSR
ncbi:hypothetical protein SAMN05216241_1262 [Limimonas halophila]|uniref:Uncharacterized protein n=2 Tax=Limimonas halophila TaxID=1082479 RepID=A0A1G7VBN0_9PROT|nr:hypothetical protein [Limimonas halophila]SDG56958.1 hypothetical protein SAMN05216241_1262 [Limimonas halophila]